MYIPPGNLLQKALSFAVQKHSGQYRDSIQLMPYVMHPIDVMLKLRYIGGITDEKILCAAVLHDILEETNTDEDEIDREFGSFIMHLVLELTRNDLNEGLGSGLSKSEKRDMRSDNLIREIEQKMGHDAKMIKLADRASNLEEAIRSRRGERLARYLRQTSQILEAIPREVNPALWKYLSKRHKKACKKIEVELE